MSTIMNRFIVVVALGLSVSACNSSWLPDMPTMSDFPSMTSFTSQFSSLSGPQALTLKIDSNPSGAEARVSSTSSCRTPCTLTLKTAGEFTVDVSLSGFEPQHLPVKVMPPEDPRFGSEGDARGPRLVPDSLFVELVPVQSRAQAKPRRAR
jgi:hypothetical protein